MNTPRDPDRLIRAFLMEGATELADEVYVTVRDRIDHTRQRAVIGSWREPDVNRYLKIALAVAAVVVVAVVGFRQFGGADVTGPGATPSTSPTATPAETVGPSPSDAGAAPPLTGTFTGRHGITLSYPDGWVTRPATEAWTTGLTDYMSKAGDVMYDPVLKGDLWIAVASQSIGDAAPDRWASETIALDDGCDTTDPITVDGAPGLIGNVNCTRATVTADGRGYFFWLYTGGDDPSLGTTYDKAWFEDFLATVQLPSGTGSNPLTETFTSDRYGIAMSYPSGWVTRPATQDWTTGVTDYISNTGDVIYDAAREGDLWIAFASQPIGDASPDQWAAETIAFDDGCTMTEPITVDGVSGLIGAGDCTRFAGAVDGRGYFIWLYTGGDDPSLGDTYGRAWFEQVLATVQLQP